LIELAEEQDRAKRREVAAKAGEADHVRKSFRAEVKRVAESIVRKAQKLGRPVTRREITQTITSKKRAYIPEALDMAVHETGWLTEKDDKFAVGPVPLDNGS
jgi:DNA-directed RNA polymerase specialized sigma subunit